MGKEIEGQLEKQMRDVEKAISRRLSSGSIIRISVEMCILISDDKCISSTCFYSHFYMKNPEWKSVNITKKFLCYV